ncbi:MAG: hypothetical protein KAW14_00165 [Candidatus Aegiribacteria sp.]|nr:hypothetical protein [Candidatus Aegiribacteria sp.]
MSSARLLLLFIGIAFLWFIIRQVMKHWLGGPDREELYREIDSAERMIEREAGTNIPRCPLCDSPTKLYKYPHIRVWRCCNYPECRGFVKAKKPARMKFASDWDRKRNRKK